MQLVCREHRLSVCVSAFLSATMFVCIGLYAEGHIEETLFNTHVLITSKMLNFIGKL